MFFEKAAQEDIEELVTLRIAYLEEDHGVMSKEALQSIKADLPDYFARHLNNDVIAYIARNEERIVSCAILYMMEKPMSPAFLNGKVGTVMNVYTRPGYRRRGYAKQLMEMLLSDAVDKNLCFVELKATEEGYDLYKSLGFKEEVSRYHYMKWSN